MPAAQAAARLPEHSAKQTAWNGSPHVDVTHRGNRESSKRDGLPLMAGVFSSLRGATHLHHAAEPYHSVVYHSPEPAAAAAACGLVGWSQYLLARCAPLTPTPPSAVAALVFGLDARLIEDAWTPIADRLHAKEATAVVFDGVDRALRRLLGRIANDEMTRRAADLASTAAAACDNAGRPLAAAWAATPKPDEPHLALWHALTVLREHRGAAHAAVLLTRGISADEAHVLAAHAASLDPRALHRAKGKTEAQWSTAYASLEDRGWLDESGELTRRGRLTWQSISRDTDALDQQATRVLGVPRCVALHRSLMTLSDRIVAAGEFPWPNTQTLQWRFFPRRDHR